MSKYLIAILLSAWSISSGHKHEKLQQLGMENIQTVTEVNGNTTIAFEDNVYRGTYRGIGKAIEAAMEGMYGEICKWWCWSTVSPAMHYAER